MPGNWPDNRAIVTVASLFDMMARGGHEAEDMAAFVGIDAPRVEQVRDFIGRHRNELEVERQALAALPAEEIAKDLGRVAWHEKVLELIRQGRLPGRDRISALPEPSYDVPLAALIHDRGHGPEIIGTRITILGLMPYLVIGYDYSALAAQFCLGSRELLAAVHYAETHVEEMLRAHRSAEAWVAQGEPPEIRAKLEQSSRRFQLFKSWLAARPKANGSAPTVPNGSLRAEFHLWLAGQETADAGR